MQGDAPTFSAFDPAAELLQYQVDQYTHHQRRRLEVRPGITGWAQVNGLRGQVLEVASARKRVEYDLEYIEKWSIWFDLAIIFRSVGIVLFQNENAF